MKRKTLLRWLLLPLLFTACTHVSSPTPSITETITRIDPATLSEDTFAIDSGEHTIELLFVNAGKADCTILKVDGKTYLIDTGEDSSVPEILAALAYLETDSIEAVFLTHTDKDHIGGWNGIQKRYSIGKLFTANINEAPEVYTDLAEGISYETLTPGQSVPIGNAGLYLDVLCPITLYPGEENNNSLVLRLDHGKETVLFTGDMKESEEADLLSTGFALDCTVLKVPYHGRKGATTQAFLDACTPELSIICCNTDTDPDTANKKVIRRLENTGEVYLTEDASLGWLVTLAKDSHTLTNVQIKTAPTADLTITEVSIEKQTITIVNDGVDTDLTGYYLYSDRGSELFVFPDDYILQSGESVTIGCVGSMEELIWQGETNVWHKNKTDHAILYDQYGNVLCEKKAK